MTFWKLGWWFWGAVTLGLVLSVTGCGGSNEDPSPTPAVTPTPTPAPAPFDVDQDGFPVEGGDCDDANSSVYPGAAEIAYDGIDQDCKDGDLVDVDKDGFVAVEAGGDDCDDAKARINPAVPEACDGEDNNCSGGIDEGVETTYYQDKDADTFGNAAATVLGCRLPAGYVENSEDCNDDDALINPNAQEICDGQDNNCVNGVDEIGSAATGKCYVLDRESAYNLEIYGGDSGDYIELSCPKGYVVIGMRGEVGLWFGNDALLQLNLECVALNPDGVLGSQVSLIGVGYETDQPYAGSCASGEMLVEAYGAYSEDFVTTIGGHCATLNRVVTEAGGHDSSVGPWGVRETSYPSFSDVCHAGDVITGLVGYTGAVVDQIGFRCTPVLAL